MTPKLADKDRDELDRMASQGDDLSLSRPINFAVVFKNSEVACSFAEYMGGLGYVAAVAFTEIAGGLPWDVVVVKSMVPSIADIRSFERFLKASASPLGGDNDGWSCFQHFRNHSYLADLEQRTS